MAPLFILTIGGTLFGLGMGVIIGYYLGRRALGRQQQVGFTVTPVSGKSDASVP